MKATQGLIKVCQEAQFNSKVPLPRLLTSKEVKRLTKAIADRLDPKEVKSTPQETILTDDSYTIIINNKKSMIFIDGDTSVKSDIIKSLKDAKIV